MTTQPRFTTLSFALAGSLLLGGTACVGFINDGDSGNDEVGDGDTGTGDGDGDGDVVDTTIYSLQQGEVADTSVVTLVGVVVTSPVNVDDGLAFVEEPAAGEYSGIALYLYSEVVLATPLNPGDVVTVTGEYTEFFGLSQLVVKSAGDISVTGTDVVPGPDIVSASAVARTNAGAEPWEGVRIQISAPVISEANDGFGQYVLEGDVLVGNAFIDPLPQVQIGGTFTSITGSLHYSFDEFKLQPATPGDLAGYEVPAEPTAATIYDIQQGNVAVGTFVELQGVVASSGFTWSDTAEATFFVQETAGGPYSGIQVFVANGAGLSVAPGDELTIVGTYDEFFEMSQIEVNSATGVTATGTVAAPTPELIADPASIATGGASATEYESVLVQVENVVVTNVNPDDPMEFGEFMVTGDLRIDDEFFAMNDWTKPALDAAFTSITGVLVFDFMNFKLEPRDAGDLVAN